MNYTVGSNMLLIKSTWNEGETFRLLPLSSECPYVECIWDPGTKVFVVISRITKTTLHMLPKLDDNGDPAPLKTKRANGRLVKEERKTIETFQEFYVEDLDAIESIVDLFAVNADKFDYKAFMQDKK
jgi:hypothetical protein